MNLSVSKYILMPLTALMIGVAMPNPVLAGGIIFDNLENLPGGEISSAIRSDLSIPPGNNLPTIAADDFQLNSGENTLTNINWWGLYDLYPITSDNFQIRIYEDSAGKPNSQGEIINVIGTLSKANTGNQIFDLDIYSYSFDFEPIVLEPDVTYWLSVVNDTSNEAADWFWATGGVNGGNITYSKDLGSTWIANKADAEAAFQLAYKIPEPNSAVSLLFFSILGLLSTRTYRK